MNAYEREKAFFKEVAQSNNIWILADEHGCVMLNSDDEDCVPVWPSEALATEWANEDWENCEASSISINKWKSRWTNGLAQDDLAIVIYPDKQGEGCVIDPFEFEALLEKSSRAKSQK